MISVMLKFAAWIKKGEEGGYVTFAHVLQPHTHRGQPIMSPPNQARVTEGTDWIGPLIRRCVCCLCNCVLHKGPKTYMLLDCLAHTHTHTQKNPPKVKPWNEVTPVECGRLRKTELRRQEGMSNREGWEKSRETFWKRHGDRKKPERRNDGKDGTGSRHEQTERMRAGKRGGRKERERGKAVCWVWILHT